MRILSIETSCDETAIALLEITGPLEKPEVKILGNSLFSQAKLHEQYGGVHPSMAKREHLKNLPVLLEKVLAESTKHRDTELKQNTGDQSPNIDFIAVTTGPGLEPALWTGINFAQELGKKWNKPVIGINHMEGHIYSVLTSAEGLVMPAMALLVSGGHTELVEVEDFGKYKLLGHTLDDAAGEAFDKCARMLGLPYPGGPAISALAAMARTRNQEPNHKLPRPMINSGNLNFSFSGLKTAVLYKVRDSEVTEDFKMQMAREFEEAVTDVLTSKTRQAIKTQDAEPRTLIVAGGVAANMYLKERFERLIEEFPGLKLYIPTRELATDNAVMIGLAAYIKVMTQPEALSNSAQVELRASGNLSF